MPRDFTTALERLREFRVRVTRRATRPNTSPDPLQDDPLLRTLTDHDRDAAELATLCAGLWHAAGPEIRDVLAAKSKRFDVQVGPGGEVEGTWRRVAKDIRSSLSAAPNAGVASPVLAEHDVLLWVSPALVSPPRMMLELPVVVKDLGRPELYQRMGNVRVSEIRLALGRHLAWDACQHVRGARYILLCQEAGDSPRMVDVLGEYHRSLTDLADAVVKAAEDVAGSATDRGTSTRDTGGDQDGTRKGSSLWHPFAVPPPAEGYHPDPLRGKQVEIGPALADAGILPRHTKDFREAIVDRLNDGRFWGRRKGHEHELYVAEKYCRPDQLDTALKALAAHRAGGNREKPRPNQAKADETR